MHTIERPNIGISFFASSNPRHSIWSNGTLQNILFLMLMLQASDQTGEVWLINYGDADVLPPWLRLAGLDIKLVRFDEVAPQLDVLIEGGAQLTPEQAEIVHQRGGVVIAYRCGNDYIMDAERICFDLQPGSMFNGTHFDEVWTQAQHVSMCRNLWEIGLRAPVRVMPHIWSPRFIRLIADNLHRSEPDTVFGYQAGTSAKRVAVFEPNLNVIKTFITPLLICETAYRQDPKAISEVYITNTCEITEHPSFQSLTQAMDLYRDKIISFEARYSLPLFLARFTDVVVSHQWENGLNYLYYDVLYGGYPLIHNSPFLREVGYYYSDFDAKQGASALLWAIHHHDQHLADYNQRTQHLLSQVDISNPVNQACHIERLFALLAAKALTH